MSLLYYIPNRDVSIRVGRHGVPVLGIHNFKIEIERLKAFFSVWVDIDSAKCIIGTVLGIDAIQLTPNEINDHAIFVINNNDVPCTLTRYSYLQNKHSYLVDLNFMMEKEKVSAYIYDEKDPKPVTNLFSLLDI